MDDLHAKFSDIHLRASLQEMLVNLIHNIFSMITLLKLLSHPSVAIELRNTDKYKQINHVDLERALIEQKQKNNTANHMHLSYFLYNH